MKRFGSPKKLVVAGLTAVTVAGAAFAFANSLTVTSDTLGSGTGAVAEPGCEPDVTYETTWNSGTLTFDVTKVTATTAAACDGFDIQAALVDGSGNTLWDSGAADPIPSGGVTEWSLSAGDVDAAAVTDAYATVTGA